MLKDVVKKKLSKKDWEETKRLQSIISTNYNYACKFMKKRKHWWNVYKNQCLPEKAPWQADVRHPINHIAANKLASFVTDAILGGVNKPLFKARPWSNIEATVQAMKYTRFMHYQQLNIPVADILYQNFLSMFVEGTSILHTTWEYEAVEHEKDEPSVAYKRDSEGELITNLFGEPELEVKTKKVKEKVVYKDQPVMEQVAANDFYPDPSATDVCNAANLVRRKFARYSELKELERIGRLKNVDLLLDAKTTIPNRQSNDAKGGISSKADENPDRDYVKRIRDYGMKNQDDPMIEVMEVYEPGVVSLLGNNLVILDSKRPVYRSRYPFEKFDYLPVYGQFWGTSLFEATEHLTSFVSQLECLLIDNWRQHLQGQTFIGGSVSPDAEEQIKKGEFGSVVRLTDIDDVKTERPDAPSAQAVQGLQLLLQEAKETMAVEGALTNSNPSSVRDSGSFEMFQRITQVTNSVLIRRIAEKLKNVGKQWHALNKQFISEKVTFSIGNTLSAPSEAQEEIDVKEIPLSLDLDVQLSSMAEAKNDRELKQISELVNLIVQSGDPTLITRPLLLQMASKIDSIEDPHDIIEQNPEIVARNAAIKARAAGKQNPTIAGKYAPQTGMQGPPAMGDGGGAPSNVEQGGGI